MKRPALFLTLTLVLAGMVSTLVVGEGLITGRIKPPLDVRVDYTIPDPTVAPTASIIAGSSSCTVGEAHQLAIYEMNSGGITKISPASGSVTPSNAAIRVLRATRPTLSSATTYWGVAWAKASEGFGTWRTCVTSAAQDASTVSVSAVGTTFNCLCQSGTTVQSSNTTAMRTVSRVDSAGIERFGSFGTVPRAPLTENQNWFNFSGVVPPTFSLDSGSTFFSMYPMIGNEVHVCKSGCSYSTIAAALTAITDAANNKRYTVVVHAGDWSESITLKSYVSIMGTGRDSTRIQSITSNSTNQTEMGVFNLTAGSVSGPSGTTPGKTFYVAGNTIGIIDGSAPWGDTLNAMASAGQFVIVYSGGNVYRAKNTGASVYVDADFRSRGDHFIINQASSSGDIAGGGNPTACAILRDESGARSDVAGAIIEVTSSSTTDPAAGLGCVYNLVIAASTRTSRMKIVGSTIRVTGTNASRNAGLACVVVPTGGCTAGGDLADTIELRDVDCVVEAADSSSTLRGIYFPSDTDHANWTQIWQGGSIQLIGGATRYDVDNADTASGSSTTLMNVQRAGALNGAGKTYTIGNYPAAACSAKCTVGQECTNTSPALCLCTGADTWTKVSGGGSCP